MVIGTGEGGVSKRILKEVKKLNGIRSNFQKYVQTKQCPITGDSKHCDLFHKKMTLIEKNIMNN